MKRPAASRQIHVRVSTDLKKAVKMFCVRSGTTEQSWIQTLVESELHRKAPDLWVRSTKEGSASGKTTRRAR